MHNDLARSVLIATLFWVALSVVAFLYWMSPEEMRAAIGQVVHFYEEVAKWINHPELVPKPPVIPDTINLTSPDGRDLVTWVILYYSVPVVLAASFLLLLGVVARLIYIAVVLSARGLRIRPRRQDKMEKQRLGLGGLPQTSRASRITLRQAHSAWGVLDHKHAKSAYKKLPRMYRDLADEILATMAAYPDRGAGDRHTDRSGKELCVMDHSMNVLDEAARLMAEEELSDEERCWLFASALAHDIGKLEADTEAQWARHDKIGADMLTTMNAFRALPLRDMHALSLIVGYYHSPWTLPKIPHNKVEGTPYYELDKSVRKVIEILRKADGLSTVREQESAIPLDEEVMGTTVEVLRIGNYNYPGAPSQPPKLGWVLEDEIIILPSPFLRKLDEEKPGLTSRLGTAQPEIVRSLLQIFDKHGVLVTEFQGVKAKSPIYAQYKILAGEKEFDWVFILRHTDETRHLTLSKKTTYEIKVLGLMSGGKKGKPKATAKKEGVKKLLQGEDSGMSLPADGSLKPVGDDIEAVMEKWKEKLKQAPKKSRGKKTVRRQTEKEGQKEEKAPRNEDLPDKGDPEPKKPSDGSGGRSEEHTDLPTTERSAREVAAEIENEATKAAEGKRPSVLNVKVGEPEWLRKAKQGRWGRTRR